MRPNAFATRLSLAIVTVLAVATFAGASCADAADRRLIVTPNADYSGFDFRQINNADLATCQSACLGDAMCRAFTFNAKASRCFLKSDFGALTAFDGATAGRVVVSPELTPTLERTRLAELAILPDDQIDEARALVGELKRRYPTVVSSHDALRTAAAIASRANRADEAASDFARALLFADDDAQGWLDFSRASLARNPSRFSDQVRALTDATGAAINAYLRSETDADRAQALALAADALGRRAIWKPAIRAYRASLALIEAAPVRDAYEQAVAEHGFRVISHEIEADSAVPQICVRFSDALATARTDLSDYVTVDGGDGLAIEPQESQICIDGVKHGVTYVVRLRAGLPAEDGESLLHPVEISAYVRDRAPWVGFAGNSYILPAGPGASIPLDSVNTDTAKATIYRIGDRGVAEAVRDGRFLSGLSRYTAQQIADERGEKVWEGTIGIAPRLNETVTTAIPIADALPEMKPGVYAITAAPGAGAPDTFGPFATQWFVVSDLGLTALSASDGVHAIVRALSSAQPVGGVRLRLIAVNNEVLAEATTDTDGYARFAPGLARGTGGRAPQLVVAETDDDYAFLDLGRAAFDLTDRGVEGRPAPSPLDVFLTPERGIYRPGETVHLTALVRDARANAVGDLPLTLVVDRPDGVEAERRVLNDGGLGGYSADVALNENAMRGAWRVKVYADPKGTALAETSVLVEDFEPERLAFDLATTAEAFDPATPAPVNVTARYLYGAPAPDLAIDGDVTLKPTDTFAAYPGYRFGLTDESVQPEREPVTVGVATDADGKATFDVAVPLPPASSHPFTASLTVRIADTNGRAVERTLSRPVKATAPMIGVKPLFDGEVGEGATASFEAILVGADGARAAKAGVVWKLERLETDYQWYRSNGTWNYELITNAARVDGGTVDFAAAEPARIAARVDWGRYRLTVEDDTAPAATSVEFYAGWYRAVATSETPDTLQVALDEPTYRIGDTAHLRLDPQFAGIALITVVDDRLIAMKSVEVPESGTTVDLDVTDQWGPGAYVTATLYRPMDLPARRMPSRAIGLTWAKVDPGDRQLAVSLDLPDEVRPRGPMTIPVSIRNLTPGAEAYVTVAAVDVGILNLTNFATPAPDDRYFGQRRLGMDIRDVYGFLIDRTQGALGTVRSGGDSGAVRLSAPPPTQKLLAFYSGILKVDANGKASVTFDLPDFNGSVRVMAMAWTTDGVGHAATDVFVRDPVVVTASLPRFLALGNSSRLLVEMNNVAGPAGDYRLSVATGDDLAIGRDALATPFHLDEKQRLAFTLPMQANAVGDYSIAVTLVTPTGASYASSVSLGVRPPGLPVTRRTFLPVAGGGSLTLDGALTADFVPGTGSVALSLGGAGPLDVAGILAELDRYPYGCAEQITSRAMPLVYLDDVAVSVGIAADQAVKERVQNAISGVLADQAASGAFGLWGPEGAGRDLWLDAYVTDFLTRAADKGYDVPDVARRLALDNLANRIAYAADFDHGGEDIAYALYVLARTGRAAIGDLRYYADAKLAAFSTPLAKAQIGAAISLYGDKPRAERAFAAALADLDRTQTAATAYRSDYGSWLRDNAAVLTLAAETRTDGVDVRALATRIATAAEMRQTTTQENAWLLLAAAALIEDSSSASFTIDGATVAAPLFRRFTDERLATPVTVANLGSEPLNAVVAASGVPLTPEPSGGNGFRLTRDVYTPEGKPVDLATVAQNDRFVVVLTVTAENADGGHIMVADPIPAGFEIENPDISSSGDTSAFPWLKIDTLADLTEARTDRFVAALDRRTGDPLEYRVAYTMRAVSPGTFAAPAATVEDMYRPDRAARTATGTVEVVGPTR